MLSRSYKKGGGEKTVIFALFVVLLAITPPAATTSAKTNPLLDTSTDDMIGRLPVQDILNKVNPGGRTKPAKKENKPGTSQHLIIFKGAGWGKVVDGEPAKVRVALLKDIALQLLRQYTFNTTIVIDSLNVSDNMEAVVTVTQAVLPAVHDKESLHLWPPDEVNSLITQSHFNNTLQLYKGSDKAQLVSAQMVGAGDKFNKLGPAYNFLIVLAMVAAAAMIVGLIVALFWLCCCNSKKSIEEEYYATHVPYK